MLSNRNTPFDEDGWALVIADVRRLMLLVGGGANDLNAGATDGNQEAINELGTALDEHVAAPDPHPQYLLAADYSEPVAGVAALTGFKAYDAFNTTPAPNTVLKPATISWDTSSGYNSSTGEYTAPSSGYYSAYAKYKVVSGAGFGAGVISAAFYMQVNGSLLITADTGGQIAVTLAALGTGIFCVTISTVLYLTAGDKLTLLGGASADPGVTWYLTEGVFIATKIGT